MPSKVLWETSWVSKGSVLTTELNALAAAGRSAVGSAVVDNGTNLDQFGILELRVTFGSAPAAGGRVDLYMVTAPDGTNFEDGSATVDPGNHKLVASLPVRADTTAQRLVCRPFALEPAKTKFLVVNNASVAFPASGSTLALYTSNDEVQDGSASGYSPTIFVGAGVGHAAGLVPDPGATAHPNQPYFLGDDAAFHKRKGECLGVSYVEEEQTTILTTYTDLGTVQTVTFTLDEASDILVISGANLYNTIAGMNCLVGLLVDGTTTYDLLQFNCTTGSKAYVLAAQRLITGLAAGAHTFKMQFRVQGGTGGFKWRSLTVLRVG